MALGHIFFTHYFPHGKGLASSVATESVSRVQDYWGFIVSRTSRCDLFLPVERMMQADACANAASGRCCVDVAILFISFREQRL